MNSENTKINPFKKVRMDLGLTQEQFALELGLCRSSIAKKESGKVNLTYEDYKTLRTKFKVDLNDLL